MPMWRCPHCGTPQAEAARCWVCRRSSTACGSCRHFRRSVAAQLGYCGQDRNRLPLIGDEIRPCWEGATAAAADPDTERTRVASIPVGVTDDRTAVRRLDFVPVVPAAVAAPEPVRPKRAKSAATPRPTAPVDAAWSLWGELEA